MDRYLLLAVWGEGKAAAAAAAAGPGRGPEASRVEGPGRPPDLRAANVYHLLKRGITASLSPEDSTFPGIGEGNGNPLQCSCL